jgi:ActR/RegA family two-component response regulator
VKECPVLVVGESVVNLLIPKDTAVGRRDVHKLDEVGVAHKIIRQYRSALQAGKGPSPAVVWVGDVQLSNGNGVDLVGGFWHSALDSLLVVV